DRVSLLDESDVAPETGLKWINEWRTRKESNTLTVTAYSHLIRNFIYDRPLALIQTIRGPMPVFIHEQVDALFVGTDISWQKEWSSSINGTLGMSFLWSQNIDDNEPLINQPPFNINYQLAWDLPPLWRGLSSRLSVRPSYTFEQFQAPRVVSPQDLIDGTIEITSDSEIFDFRDAPEGYFLLDLSWQLESRKINVGLSVQNVFNARYRNYLNEMRYFADEPGINFLLTINYSIDSKSNYQ
ncbi:MAG: TonB-dependent receptor, partial [Bacteroidota bacterium]